MLYQDLLTFSMLLLPVVLVVGVTAVVVVALEDTGLALWVSRLVGVLRLKHL
jgi:TRAP-type C4-dicarboxylate transport system permease large subunit